MKTAAFVLCLITTISSGVFLIPLAWMIPMTVYIYKAMNDEVELTVGFNVCVLLFVNTVAGILLLCEKEK